MVPRYNIRNPARHGGETLTRDKLAEYLSGTIGLNAREAREFLGRFFEEISSALERGEEVKLHGFGSFHLRNKAARPGRNPKTREMVPVTARRVVSFHASSKLRKLAEKARRRD